MKVQHKRPALASIIVGATYSLPTIRTPDKQTSLIQPLPSFGRPAMDYTSSEWSISMLLRTVKILSATGVSCVGVFAAVLYFAQSTLIYPSNFPAGSRTEVQTPKSYDLPYEDVTIDTKDGEKIKAFVMKQTDSELRVGGQTVIICCANAGNMGHRLPIASAFYKILQYNVVLFSYRGYGLSTGKPSEAGIKIDAEAIFKYVQADLDLNRAGIILYGQSLGGAVAIYLTEKYQDEVSITYTCLE